MDESNIKGLRVAPIGEKYPMFYHPGTTRIWEAAQRLGIVICAHIRYRLLDQLSDLLARFPDVPVVLDHSAYPEVAEKSNIRGASGCFCG